MVAHGPGKDSQKKERRHPGSGGHAYHESDSVMLRIRHPTATVSMPVPRENSRVEAHRSLKSR
jgi:hypothetical protein